MFGNVKIHTPKINRSFFVNNKTAFYSLAISLVAFSIGLYSLSNSPEQPTPANVAPISFQPVSTTELLAQDLNYIKPVGQILALSDVSNKDVAGVELEYQNGLLVYVVRFGDGSKQAYDTQTAQTIDYFGNNQTSIQNGDRLPPNYSPATTFKQALTKAKDQNPELAVKKIELGVETSIIIYTVYFDEETKYYVSASTGNLVSIPDPQPIDYTALNSQSQAEDDDDDDDNRSQKEKIKEWRERVKKIREDNRKKLEDYYEEYLAR